jgi:hypothetical protein
MATAFLRFRLARIYHRCPGDLFARIGRRASLWNGEKNPFGRRLESGLPLLDGLLTRGGVIGVAAAGFLANFLTHRPGHGVTEDPEPYRVAIGAAFSMGAVAMGLAALLVLAIPAALSPKPPEPSPPPAAA